MFPGCQVGVTADAGVQLEPGRLLVGTNHGLGEFCGFHNLYRRADAAVMAMVAVFFRNPFKVVH